MLAFIPADNQMEEEVRVAAELKAQQDSAAALKAVLETAPRCSIVDNTPDNDGLVPLDITPLTKTMVAVHGDIPCSSPEKRMWKFGEYDEVSAEEASSPADVAATAGPVVLPPVVFMANPFAPPVLAEGESISIPFCQVVDENPKGDELVPLDTTPGVADGVDAKKVQQVQELLKIFNGANKFEDLSVEQMIKLANLGRDEKDQLRPSDETLAAMKKQFEAAKKRGDNPLGNLTPTPRVMHPIPRPWTPKTDPALLMKIKHKRGVNMKRPSYASTAELKQAIKDAHGNRNRHMNPQPEVSTHA